MSLTTTHRIDTYRIGDPLQMQEFNVNGGWKLMNAEPFSVFRTDTSSDLCKTPVIQGTRGERRHGDVNQRSFGQSAFMGSGYCSANPDHDLVITHRTARGI